MNLDEPKWDESPPMNCTFLGGPGQFKQLQRISSVVASECKSLVHVQLGDDRNLIRLSGSSEHRTAGYVIGFPAQPRRPGPGAQGLGPGPGARAGGRSSGMGPGARAPAGAFALG